MSSWDYLDELCCCARCNCALPYVPLLHWLIPRFIAMLTITHFNGFSWCILYVIKVLVDCRSPASDKVDASGFFLCEKYNRADWSFHFGAKGKSRLWLPDTSYYLGPKSTTSKQPLGFSIKIQLEKPPAFPKSPPSTANKSNIKIHLHFLPENSPGFTKNLNRKFTWISRCKSSYIQVKSM